MNLRNFNDLKDRFYKIIVEEKYGRCNLERVKAGDTRHFAIINMCLQGFSMHNIATLAGHSELKLRKVTLVMLSILHNRMYTGLLN